MRHFSRFRRKGFNEAVASISQLLTPLGLPRSCVRVLAALYASEAPLSGRELAEVTGYSKSAISAAVRMLERNCLIYRLKRGRESAYVPSVGIADLVLEAQAKLIERVRSRIRSLKTRVNSTLSSKLHLLDKELEILLTKLRGEASEGG